MPSGIQMIPSINALIPRSFIYFFHINLCLVMILDE
jgi:hypothetical protein